MRHFVLAAVLAVAVQTAALACSCIASDDPAELRSFGADAAKYAVALVEVEVLKAYDPATGRGEIMRVAKIVAGTSPAQFQIPRSGPPFGASCDVEYRAGQRVEVILYPADRPGSYRTSGLCTALLLEKPAFRDELIRQIGARPAGERG